MCIFSNLLIYSYFFIFLFSRIAAKYPMLYMEEIYNSATATYTDDPVLLIAYAFFVTVVFCGISGMIMLKKIEGEYR